MSFTLAQLLAAVRRDDVVITADTAGYLVLAAAEQIADGRPWDVRTVCLEDSGAVTVHHGEQATRSEARLRTALGRLLEHAAGDNPGLAQCVNLSQDDVTLLVAALRAALLPLNRSAARRALMRLHRRLLGIGERWLGSEELAPSPEPEAAGDHGGSTALEAPVARAPGAETVPVEFAGGESEESETTPSLGSLGVDLTSWSEAPNSSVGAAPDAPRDGGDTLSLWGDDGAPVEPAAEPPVLESSTRSEPLQELVQPPPDEATDPDTVAVDHEPGLGRILPKKSNVAELVSRFTVPEPKSIREVALALRRSVERQGTPLPPPTGRRAQRRRL